MSRLRSLRRTVRHALRVARWEVRTSAGELDRRTVAMAVGVLAVGALLLPALAGGGVAIDRGLYRVGIADGSPYTDAVDADPALTAAEPSEAALERGRIDLLVRDGRVAARDTRKSRAALARFGRAVERHNVRLMRMEAREGREDAAFPVTVALVYSEQRGSIAAAGGADGDGGGGGGGGEGAGSDADGGLDAGSFTAPSPGAAVPGSGRFLEGGQRARTPASIAPPFPFESLLLAFLFLIPMNFVIQAFSSTVMDERVNRRGELLLASPLRPRTIVAGKTLPYLAAALAITAAIAAAIGGGPVAFAAIVPVALAYLATSFVGAMFARSFKELTFVTVAISVLLTTYLFVPAIFTRVHPIAAISPLTLVVQDLQGQTVSLADYAFSTAPLYLSSAVLFALGVGVYREEDMFTQRALPLKALDAIASRLRRVRSLALVQILFIPFVLALELLVLATLFALPVEASLPLLLLGVATVEEVAKSAPVYAGFEHRVFGRDLRTAVLAGAVSGFGFFLAEKLLIVVQLVGIPELALGRAAFGVGPGAGLLDAGPAVMVAVAAAPLLLHVATTATAAVGASRGRRQYGAALVVAIAVHTAYNLGVVTAFGL